MALQTHNLVPYNRSRRSRRSFATAYCSKNIMCRRAMEDIGVSTVSQNIAHHLLFESPHVCCAIVTIVTPQDPVISTRVPASSPHETTQPPSSPSVPSQICHRMSPNSTLPHRARSFPGPIHIERSRESGVRCLYPDRDRDPKVNTSPLLY